MIEGDLWLENARAANAAAREIASACGSRLLHPVEANEVFVSMSPTEQAALHAQGFEFYDWAAPAGHAGAARLVTAWNSDPAHVAALTRAIANL
jgi:threonine aldolase